MLANVTDAIGDYYKNPLYEADFVEKIVVFDSAGFIDDQNFVDIVANELYVEATVFSVDKHKDILDIITRELN